jgi:hypothetical protein
MYMGTRRIADNQPGSQVNDPCPVLHHLFTSVLDISARASITRRVANQFHIRAGIYTESAFFVLHRTEAFPTGTVAVAIANNDPYLYFFAHYYSFDI